MAGRLALLLFAAALLTSPAHSKPTIAYDARALVLDGKRCDGCREPFKERERKKKKTHTHTHTLTHTRSFSLFLPLLRTMMLSGGMHYPRVPEADWARVMADAKEMVMRASFVFFLFPLSLSLSAHFLPLSLLSAEVSISLPRR